MIAAKARNEMMVALVILDFKKFKMFLLSLTNVALVRVIKKTKLIIKLVVLLFEFSSECFQSSTAI